MNLLRIMAAIRLYRAAVALWSAAEALRRAGDRLALPLLERRRELLDLTAITIGMVGFASWGGVFGTGLWWLMS